MSRGAVLAPGHLPRSARRLILAAVLMGVTGAASACGSTALVDKWQLGVTVKNETAPDIELTEWTRASETLTPYFTGCPRARRLNVEFTPISAGFELVRTVNVDGEMYPAYGWSPTSPLVVVSFRTGRAGVPRSSKPVWLDKMTQLIGVTDSSSAGNFNMLRVGVSFKLISRGGPMTGGGMPPVQGSTRLPAYPGAGSVEHRFTPRVFVPALPCALSDTTLVLPTINAVDIGQPGATAATRPLEVTMRCPLASSNVRLTLDDANGNSARIGELMPAAGSTAKGVQLRMLRNGQPVAFGVPWDHGPRQDGINTIRLEAQYIRTDGALQPGALRGEARLTADYP